MSCWSLVSLNIIPNSVNKTYIEQAEGLKGGEEVPRACELVYFIALYYLANVIRLLESYYSRCQEKSMFSDKRFHVGVFRPNRKVDIRYYKDIDAFEKIGIVSVRKFSYCSE